VIFFFTRSAEAAPQSPTPAQTRPGARYFRCATWILERPKGASPEGREPEDEALRGKTHLPVSCGPASSSKYRLKELWNYLLAGLGNPSGLPRNRQGAVQGAASRLGTGFSARTQKRPCTHGRIFLAGGRLGPELFSRPWSACRCGCNGPALELGRAGLLQGSDP
jgi:hypothetical protein